MMKYCHNRNHAIAASTNHNRGSLDRMNFSKYLLTSIICNRYWRRCGTILITFILILFLASPTGAYVVEEDSWDRDRDEDSSVEARTRRAIISSSNPIQNFDFDEIIPSDYNIHTPPPTNGTPTEVQLSVLILNVRDIKELSEELTLEVNLRMYWKDTRLSHLANLTRESLAPFLVLNSMILDKIWHPDVFIDHVKTVTQPSLISRPASLRIYPDSTIRYSARLTLAQACQMDFHYYPADTQRCNVDMKSYAYTDTTLHLIWKENKGAALVNKLYLPNFDVGLDNTKKYDIQTTSGRYSVLRFTVLLRRKLSYHLLQTYLPSTLFIFVSWLSFLVPPESVPGRMALCMTTLLTLTAMFASVRQNTPNVSYVKALDIWMVVCIIFVFLTLLEYTVLLKLKSKKEKQKKKNRKQNRIANASSGVHGNGNGQSNGANGRICRNISRIYQAAYSEYPTIQIRRPTLSAPGLTDGGNLKDPPVVVPNGESILPLPGSPAPSRNSPTPSFFNSTKHPTKYEVAAKKIEKFTSAIIPTLFIVFNFVYWPWLLESASYYQHFDSTLYD